VDDAAEAVATPDVESGELAGICDWIRERVEGTGVGDSPVGPVGVVVPLVLAEGVQQVRLVHTSVRSSSSRRQLWIHRSMIANETTLIAAAAGLAGGVLAAFTIRKPGAGARDAAGVGRDPLRAGRAAAARPPGPGHGRPPRRCQLTSQRQRRTPARHPTVGRPWADSCTSRSAGHGTGR
jgi:hypothetical protein